MENRSFARLLGDGENQVVLMVDTDDDDRPCLSLTFNPKVEGMKLSTLYLSFNDSDKGVQAAYAALDKMPEQTVLEIAEKSRTEIRELTDKDK